MLQILHPLWAFVALLAVHWVGDFFLQSHWMSIHKSKRVDALLMHVGIYSAVLLVGTIAIFGTTSESLMITVTPAMLIFVALNGALHLGTDFVTSRITSALWKQERIHDFFVMIGVDQFIHQFTLAATMWWLI